MIFEGEGSHENLKEIETIVFEFLQGRNRNPLEIKVIDITPLLIMEIGVILFYDNFISSST